MHYEKFADGSVKCIEDEIPFDLPEGWTWERLISLTVKIGAGSTPTGGASVYSDSGVKFIRSQNVYDDGLILDDGQQLSMLVTLLVTKKPQPHSQLGVRITNDVSTTSQRIFIIFPQSIDITPPFVRRRSHPFASTVIHNMCYEAQIAFHQNVPCFQIALS